MSRVPEISANERVTRLTEAIPKLTWNLLILLGKMSGTIGLGSRQTPCTLRILTVVEPESSSLRLNRTDHILDCAVPPAQTHLVKRKVDFTGNHPASRCPDT